MAKIRRNAKEWNQIVHEWNRSGLTAAEFASKRGLRKNALIWWCWRIQRDEALKATTSGGVQLVPVEVESEAERRGGVGAEKVVWEIAGPNGHVLRVYDRGAIPMLRKALDLIMDGGRQR